MKKILLKKLDNLLYEYGWFAIITFIVSIIVFILLVCHVVTPFINNIIWGMS